MALGIAERVRWLYWRSNRKFLEKFSESSVGRGAEAPPVDGSQIMNAVEGLLRKMPASVFQQATVALVLMPMVVPKRLPRSNVLRVLLKIWIVLRSHVERPRFAALSFEERAAKLDQLFTRLASQMPEQEDDLVNTAVILAQIKSLIAGAFFELDAVWRAIGYSPYPEPPRSWNPPSGPIVQDPPRSQIGEFLHNSVATLREVARKPADRTTYCVIGSGAGGAIAALTILERDPSARVLMLEEGPLVTNEAFPTKLFDASTRLYMNNAMTLSKDMLSTFRQGRCVGGSTTLNNSVAFKPVGYWWDQNIVERWQAVGADLDWKALYANYDELAPMLNVHPIEDRVITKMSDTVAEGFRELGYQTLVAPSNSHDCIGCGRCNVGCQYDAKRSMLITAIPEFIRNGGFLVPDAKVQRLQYAKSRAGYVVSGVLAKDANGEKVTVEVDRVVLAAGTYASSKLLWKSGFTGIDPGVRTVGKRFVANMGTPVVARFPTPQYGSRGQQIGFAVELPTERIVIETGFAPPAVLGLLAPQWGAEFMRFVESFNRLGIAIPVLAGETYGEFTRGLLPTVGWALDYRLGGFVIDYRMGSEDWIRLVKGMKLAARAMFLMGAEEVYTTRFSASSIKSVDDIDAYFNGMGPIDYLRVESAHLHGGNVIHHDPAQGVVDTDCKVHGFANLWIMDASVIPAAITLNLQYTVMAVARYAAKRMVAS